MNLEQYNGIVLEYRNSMIVIGIISLSVCTVAVLISEIYVRGSLGCRFFHLGRIKFSPTLVLVIPFIAMLIYYSCVVINCNRDIANGSYETYIGTCSYESETVELEDVGLRIYVGNGHEIVPSGKNYGKCTYSKHSKVIVAWENMTHRTD